MQNKFEFGQKLFLAEDGKLLPVLYCGTSPEGMLVRHEDGSAYSYNEGQLYASEAEGLEATNQKKIEQLKANIKWTKDRIRDWTETLAQKEKELEKLLPKIDYYKEIRRMIEEHADVLVTVKSRKRPELNMLDYAKFALNRHDGLNIIDISYSMIKHALDKKLEQLRQDAGKSK